MGELIGPMADIYSLACTLETLLVCAALLGMALNSPDYKTANAL